MPAFDTSDGSVTSSITIGFKVPSVTAASAISNQVLLLDSPRPPEWALILQQFCAMLAPRQSIEDYYVYLPKNR